MLDAKTWLDIHIIGAGAYVNNNLVATNSRSIINIIQTQDFQENDLKFRQGRDPYHAYNRSFLQILSAVWSQGNHAAGLSFGGYSYTDARRINDPAAEFIENGIASFTAQHLTDYSLDKFNSNNLTYGEAKISYAYTFLRQQKNMFMAGISYKKIFPIVGGSVKIQELSYNVYNDTVLHINNFIGDARVNNEAQFSMKGGWGFDLGFTYQKMYSGCGSYYPNSRKGGCNRLYYKYKIGVSINDIGYAKFSEDNINYVGYTLENVDILYYGNLDTDLNTFPTILASEENNPTEGIIKKPYKTSLPTSISIQYDQNIVPHFFYINATIVHGLSPGKKTFGPRRAHSISITPRLESKWIDIALPLSLYEYSRPQLGLSLRAYILTIGTDKLLNYFIPTDVYGADIYFHLKLPLYRNPSCKGKGNSSRKSSGWRGKNYPKCDAYR
jgi:hypothetical protein